ncbi:hypothetical protein niasHT_015304 [Heterodera trifolii]|uniref:Uncharacterized protein n=1 Tax=Heterodera trifolii TaxID=157864 RepID=A0ABD2KZH0_9BILA
MGLGGGGYAPFLGAYSAAPPYTGAYATGIYAAAPAAALFSPCCATTFGGVFGFRRRKRNSEIPPVSEFATNRNFLQKETSFVNTLNGYFENQTHN